MDIVAFASSQYNLIPPGAPTGVPVFELRSPRLDNPVLIFARLRIHTMLSRPITMKPLLPLHLRSCPHQSLPHMGASVFRHLLGGMGSVMMIMGEAYNWGQALQALPRLHPLVFMSTSPTQLHSFKPPTFELDQCLSMSWKPSALFAASMVDPQLMLFSELTPFKTHDQHRDPATCSWMIRTYMVIIAVFIVMDTIERRLVLPNDPCLGIKLKFGSPALRGSPGYEEDHFRINEEPW
ncbi:hypothetical protein ONZ45_g11054 [Pleurotus djamor]|nr:hypothetical protein ONZ45_g11054 [Pleurotus djamor]